MIPDISFNAPIPQVQLGSVWIGLILLKLKTYCWNHCSKIIFKCVNSTVGPIFNEKIDKKWNLWVHKQYTNTLFTGKSQHLRLLFMQQCINSNHIPPKTRKKKKKKNAKRRQWNADVLSKLSLNIFRINKSSVLFRKKKKN